MDHIPDYGVSRDLNNFENKDDVKNNDFKHRDGESEYKNTTFNPVTLEEIKDGMYIKFIN